MAEDPERRRRAEFRLPAILRDVVDVDLPDVGGQVAGHRHEQPAALAEDERLVRGVHGRGDEAGGECGMRRVGHVQHVHAALLVERVGGPHEGRVVVGALMAGGVHVALDLEAAHRALRVRLAVLPHQLRVAGEALGRPSALVVLGAHPPLDTGLGARTRAALSARRRGQRRLVRERRLRCPGGIRKGHGAERETQDHQQHEPAQPTRHPRAITRACTKPRARARRRLVRTAYAERTSAPRRVTRPSAVGNPPRSLAFTQPSQCRSRSVLRPRRRSSALPPQRGRRSRSHTRRLRSGSRPRSRSP